MKRAVLLLPLLAISCARQQAIPHYPLMGPAESLRVVRERAATIRTIQAQATLTLTDDRDESVTFDGVILVQAPNRIRVRAWKFGQAVFDLTATEDGTWQYVTRDEAKPATGVTREVARKIVEFITGGGPRESASVTLTTGGIEVASLTQDALLETRRYDRSTLTLASVCLMDGDGTVFQLLMDEYRVVNDHVWPTRVRAVSGDRQVLIRFSDVEINADLPSAAFKPPARAERVP